MGARRIAIAIVALASVSFATPAAAAPFERVDEAWGRIVTDGVRHYAYVGTDGKTHVVDDETGAARTFETPAPPVEPQAPNCWTEIAAIAPGYVAWDGACNAGFERKTTVLETATGRRAEADLSRIDRSEASGTSTTTAVGAHWLERAFSGYHQNTTRYLNWRDGQVSYQGPASARDYADLDERDLASRLCAPLRRRSDPNTDPYNNTDPFYSFDFARPYGLTGPGPSSTVVPLELRRCGSGARRKLSSCRGSQRCTSVQLGGGRVSWRDQRLIRTAPDRYRVHTRVRLYATRTGERDALVPPDEDAAFTVAHTRHHVYVAYQEFRYPEGVLTASYRAEAPPR